MRPSDRHSLHIHTFEKTSIIRSGNAIINLVIDTPPLGFELPPTGGAVGIVKRINFVFDSAAPPIAGNSKPEDTLSIILYTRDYNLIH